MISAAILLIACAAFGAEAGRTMRYNYRPYAYQAPTMPSQQPQTVYVQCHPIYNVFTTMVCANGVQVPVYRVVLYAGGGVSVYGFAPDQYSSPPLLYSTGPTTTAPANIFYPANDGQDAPVFGNFGHGELENLLDSQSNKVPEAAVLEDKEPILQGEPADAASPRFDEPSNCAPAEVEEAVEKLSGSAPVSYEPSNNAPADVETVEELSESAPVSSSGEPEITDSVFAGACSSFGECGSQADAPDLSHDLPQVSECASCDAVSTEPVADMPTHAHECAEAICDKTDNPSTADGIPAVQSLTPETLSKHQRLKAKLQARKHAKLIAKIAARKAQAEAPRKNKEQSRPEEDVVETDAPNFDAFPDADVETAEEAAVSEIETYPELVKNEDAVPVHVSDPEAKSEVSHEQIGAHVSDIEALTEKIDADVSPTEKYDVHLPTAAKLAPESLILDDRLLQHPARLALKEHFKILHMPESGMDSLFITIMRYASLPQGTAIEGYNTFIYRFFLMERYMAFVKPKIDGAAYYLAKARAILENPSKDKKAVALLKYPKIKFLKKDLQKLISFIGKLNSNLHSINIFLAESHQGTIDALEKIKVSHGTEWLPPSYETTMAKAADVVFNLEDAVEFAEEYEFLVTGTLKK